MPTIYQNWLATISGTIKEKWTVIPALLIPAVIGTFITTSAWTAYSGAHAPKVVVDRAMRVEAIDTLVAKLNDHYVSPDKAKQIAAVLRRRQQDGKYDGMTDGEQLAKQLTADLLGVAHDLHMKVVFSRWLVRSDDAIRPRSASRPSNLGVETVYHLPPNIGYLRMSGFPPPDLVAEKYAAAMDRLADTDGLIVDLRENHGGDPQTVALLISYFVDRRTRLTDIWDRDTGTTTQQWTEDKLDGQRYGGKKPVVILAGPGTASAGEDFTYTMQALKRATVIGERTWGGAHPVSSYRLGDHFYAVIPNQSSINPITHTNWEGVGVIPDIPATPDDALAVAKDLLQRRLHETAPLVAADVQYEPNSRQRP